MNVFTEGILVKNARFTMWAARVGDQLYVSGSLDKLEKYLSNPEARAGAWVEISFLVSKNINNCKPFRIFGFVDLETGEFSKTSVTAQGHTQALRGNQIDNGSVTQKTIDSDTSALTKSGGRFGHSKVADKVSFSAEDIKEIGRLVSEKMLSTWKASFKKRAL